MNKETIVQELNKFREQLEILGKGNKEINAIMKLHMKENYPEFTFEQVKIESKKYLVESKKKKGILTERTRFLKIDRKPTKKKKGMDWYKMRKMI